MRSLFCTLTIANKDGSDPTMEQQADATKRIMDAFSGQPVLLTMAMNPTGPDGAKGPATFAQIGHEDQTWEDTDDGQ